MDDLIAKLSQKVGITPQQAKDSIEHIMAHLKANLPASVGSHLDGLMKGDTSGLGSIGGKISSMFGK